MKTKTLSLILAIAMLLCGCQTAPAQSVPAAPAVEASEPSSSVEEPEIPVEESAPGKEEQPVQHPQDTENPTEPVVAENGLKTYPAKYVKANSIYTYKKLENMSPYLLGDNVIVVIPDGSDVGYVLGQGMEDLKVFKEKNLLYHYGEAGMTFYNLETLEKTYFSLDVQCEDLKRLKEFKIQYDAALDQYAAVYAVYTERAYRESDAEKQSGVFSGGEYGWNVEIQRFDSNGKFIDKYSTEVNAETYHIEQVDIFNYNEGVIGYMARIDVGLSSDYYCVVCDFSTGKVISFQPEHKWEREDILIASRIDVSENDQNGTKTVKLTSAWLGKAFNSVVEYETVLDTDMDSELLDFGRSSTFEYIYDKTAADSETKKRTIYTPWLKFEVDYASGECTAELDSSHTVEQLENAYAYLSSEDGRYKICELFERLDWHIYNDSYIVAYDNIEKRIIHIGWVGYDVTGKDFHIRNNNELLRFDDGVISIDLTDGSNRYIVSRETAKQHAKEKLGYLGGEIGAFAYDEKLDLLVLTMYDEPSEYYSDLLLRYKREEQEKTSFNALEVSDPNYFLAVYDMNGNFIKHVLTDSVVQATGKHGSLDIGAIPVDNGIAWPDSEQAMPYMEERPKYVVNGNKAYWRPVEKTSRNILCWRDFETETTGEMLIPNEWGELVYVFDDCMIFRNTETGICYKCDMEGSLVDRFVCEDVMGMNPARWHPLPDFSGVIYNMNNYHYPETYLWTRENGMIGKTSGGWYGQKPITVRENKVIANDVDLWIGRVTPTLISLFDGKTVKIVSDIAENYPDKFTAVPKQYNAHLLLKEKQNYKMEIERYFQSTVNTSWAHIRKINGSNLDILYCLNDSRLIELPDDYIKYIKSDKFFVKENILGSFDLQEDGVHYRTLDLITNEQKSILTNLPTDYDDLRVVTVTDSGKVIIALQQDSQWKIFARDVKI